MSLLSVPFGLKKTVGAGPMLKQCESIIKALNESQEIKFILVKDKSDFSKQEGEELKAFIESRFEKRKDSLQVTNFSNQMSSSKDQLEFKKHEHDQGWLMSAKELSSHWGAVIGI